MVDIIRKDNLTDLVQNPPTPTSSGNTQPTQTQPTNSNQGKPATQAINSDGQVITLGQGISKTK